MNKLISVIFARLIEWGHIVVIIGCVLFFIQAVGDGYGGKAFIGILGALLLYIIIVGFISTFVSINETLLRIEEKLDNKTKSSIKNDK